MRIGLIFIILFFLISCSGQDQDYISLQGQISLEGNPQENLAEIRLFDYDDKPCDSLLIAYAETDHNGIFSIRIPRKDCYYKLHISSPGYKAITQDFISLKEYETIESNAELKRIRVGADCEDVRIIGDFNNWSFNAAYATKRIKDELYEVKIDYDQPKMAYQWAFGDQKKAFTIYESGKVYEYDFRGNYKIQSSSENGKYVIRIKTSDLCDDEIEGNKSVLEFPDNAVYEKLQLLESELSSDIINDLILDYYFFVEKDEPDLLRKIPRRTRKLKEKQAVEEFEFMSKLLDSLIEISTEEVVLNHALAKRVVLNVSIWGDSLNDMILSDYNRMTKIPVTEVDFFEALLSLIKIEKEPYRFLGGIREKINEESNPEFRAVLLVDYLFSVDQYLNEEGKYTEMILRELMPLLKQKNFSYSIKGEIEELYQMMKAKEKSLKPEVRFVLAEIE